MHPALQSMQKHRESWVLFGSGLGAGLLLFLAWWAMQPSMQLPGQTAAATAVTDQKKPGPAGDGVLGDITGDLEPGRPRDVAGPEVSLQEIDSLSDRSPQSGGDPSLPPGDEPRMSDEAAIAGGLLSSDDPPPAPLQTYYVEVMRGPEVSELLELEASSAEHALSILRDFRGNPRVVRGPSPQPLP